MKMSPTINDLASALAKAQGEMKNPPLDGINPHFKSRFATLAGVRDTVLPVLARHGLSVIQSAGSGSKGPTLTTLLLHASGQWVECDPLEMPASKQDAQGYGSALTYARRYQLLALAGVTGDDDEDGNQATAAPPIAKPSQKTSKSVPMTQEQSERLGMVVADLKYSKDQFERWCHKQWGVLSSADLSETQAAEAIQRLEAALAAKDKQPVSVG